MLPSPLARSSSTPRRRRPPPRRPCLEPAPAPSRAAPRPSGSTRRAQAAPGRRTRGRGGPSPSRPPGKPRRPQAGPRPRQRPRRQRPGASSPQRPSASGPAPPEGEGRRGGAAGRPAAERAGSCDSVLRVFFDGGINVSVKNEKRNSRVGERKKNETEKKKKPLRFLQHRVGPLCRRSSPFARGSFPLLAAAVGVVERDADAALFLFFGLFLRVEGGRLEVEVEKKKSIQCLVALFFSLFSTHTCHSARHCRRARGVRGSAMRSSKGN